MDLWEYKVVTLWKAHRTCKQQECGFDHKATVESQLNKMGDDGWELVHRNDARMWGTAEFKRKKAALVEVVQASAPPS